MLENKRAKLEQELYERLCVGCESERSCHENCSHCEEYEKEENRLYYNFNPFLVVYNGTCVAHFPSFRECEKYIKRQLEVDSDLEKEDFYIYSLAGVE